MSDVKPGDVFYDLDRRTTPERRLRVVEVIDAPEKAGNGAIARGPVALCVPLESGRRTRIAVARLLTRHRWTRVAPVLLALLALGCDGPPESTRRMCEDVLGVRVACIERSGLVCVQWACSVQHLEADAGPDAGVDLGVGVDAGRPGLPGNEARGLR